MYAQVLRPGRLIRPGRYQQIARHLRLVGTIAYVHGLEDHPLRDHVRVVHQLEASLAATNTMAAPDQESTTNKDDRNYSATPSTHLEYQVIQEDPEPIQRGSRRHTETRADLLDEESDDPEPLQIAEETQPAPSPVSDADFVAMLRAARQGCPGNSTPQEAPPTARPQTSTLEIEDGTSPLRTRSGIIRGPPAQPKRRKPPPKCEDSVTLDPTPTTQRGRPQCARPLVAYPATNRLLYDI